MITINLCIVIYVRMCHINEYIKSNLKCKSYSEFVKHKKLIDHTEKKEDISGYCKNCDLNVPSQLRKNHIRTNAHLDT